MASMIPTPQPQPQTTDSINCAIAEVMRQPKVRLPRGLAGCPGPGRVCQGEDPCCALSIRSQCAGVPIWNLGYGRRRLCLLCLSQ
jgi:hypothetical protein